MAHAEGAGQLKKPTPAVLREWYRKATEGGAFRDAEILDRDGSTDGRMRTDVRTDQHSLLVREGDTRAEYFRLARAFAHDHAFTSAEDRRIWERHAQGMPIERIETELRLPHARVQRAIERLAAIMRAPSSRRGRPPAGPTGHGDQQYRRRIRFSDVETEALFFIAQFSACSPIDAVRMAVLAYARALRISGAGKADTPVPKQGEKDE